MKTSFSSEQGKGLSMEKKKKSSGKKRVVNKKKRSPVVTIFKIFGTLILTVLMITIITGSIFATAVTIYILNFADTTTTVNLEEKTSTSNVTRFFYHNPDYDPDEDPDDEEWVLYYGIKSQERKPKWVNISQVPTYVQDAFVYTEDERFYGHDGVDFKRTFSAIVQTLLTPNKQGGSTITQQAIKNITGDDATLGVDSIERKIREIFRAINVEKVYTKQDILESYLNVIEFGNGYDQIIGIQSAANYYFKKDVSELNLAEAASLAGMINAPTKYNPLYNPENNRVRLDYCLRKMLENGAISDDEYEYGEQLADELKVYGDWEFSSVEAENEVPDDSGISSWFIDAAIDEAIWHIVDQRGISYEEATQRLYSGGYDIYTTVDIDMQKQMEKNMRENSNFQSWSFDNDELRSGFVCIDYEGHVLCNVSSRSKKKESGIFNLVHQGTRSPGSCIKPIASYAPALEQDLITYSSYIEDKPIKIDADSDGVEENWPVNYSEDGLSSNWSYQSLPVWQMLARSLNTAPAQLVQQMSPNYCYNFLREKLDVTTLVDGYDNDYSGMTVGGLRNGLHLEELVGAYMIFGNGGKKYETTYMTLMTETDGTPVYEQGDGYKQAISDSTAYVMNKLLQRAVTEADGTARYAKLNKTVLAAKTGTSSDWVDLNFVGVTPDYVSGVWIGYDEWKKIPTNQYQNIGAIWKNLFGDIAEKEPDHDFAMPETVTELRYCTRTGNIAGAGCPSAVGYYKDTNIPVTCSGWHG